MGRPTAQASKRNRYKRGRRQNKPWKELKSPCSVTEKIRYPTRHDAELFIQAMKYVSTATGLRPKRAYLCPYCKLWHTTSRGT